MKKISLQFKDVLQLLEFIDFTENHQCHLDVDAIKIHGELSEAEIELAVNGYGAEVSEEINSLS